MSRSGEALLDLPDTDVDAALVGVSRVHVDGYALNAICSDLVVELANRAAHANIPVTLEPASVTALADTSTWLGLMPQLDAVLGRPAELDVLASLVGAEPIVTISHDGPRPVRVRIAGQSDVLCRSLHVGCRPLAQGTASLAVG